MLKYTKYKNNNATLNFQIMATKSIDKKKTCDSCKAASDELGRGCKHGMLFPLMLIMGNFTECMNYEFDAEKVKLQLKRKEAK